MGVIITQPQNIFAPKVNDLGSPGRNSDPSPSDVSFSMNLA